MEQCEQSSASGRAPKLQLVRSVTTGLAALCPTGAFP